MERAQHRMSRSRTDSEGNRLNQKQRVNEKFLSESYSYNDGTSKEDMEILKKGKSSSKRLTGTPMKKLLAEEMSKEMETKRRSPSVIARLMGLDGLPSPQHGHKESLSGNHHQISGPIGIQEDDHLHGRSSRRISMERQEFKDVYEDLEASHVANRRYSSRLSPNLKLKEPEMSLVQQKSMDSKRLSINDKLTLGVADLNKELLLKCLKEPDSLSEKHVNDLQHDTSSSRCNHIAILKPSNSVKYEGNAKAWKSERDSVCKHDVDSHRKRKDGLLLHSINHHSAQETLKSSKHQSKEKALKSNLPTQIVVLMPGKKINGKSSVLSPDSSLAYPPDDRHMEYPSFEIVEAALREKRDLSNLVGSSRPKSKEAREVAKKITRQMRENFENFDRGPIDFTCSGVKGYAGDESSYDGYDSDSDSVSDVVTFTCRKSFGCNSRNRKSNSTSIESSVNREAKKRLSDRWKMTHGYQDEEICFKGSTLGEMLAIPNKGKKLEHLNVVSSGDRANDGYPDMTTGWTGPSGISSRDGWKDGCNKRSYRARSLPPSLGGSSQKTSEQQDALSDSRYLVTRDATSGGSSKALKCNSRRKEGSAAKDSKSGGKRPHSCQDKFVVNSGSTTKTKFSQTKTKIDLEKVETPKEQPLASSKPISYTESMPDVSSSMIQSGDSFAGDQEHSNLQEASTVPSEEGSAPLQCPDPEPESSETSKEADHPSPVSVLEVASKEERSSDPECFERVSAELQELRKQLQLLKMESEVDADMFMLVKNDDILSQTEANHLLKAECWKDYYIYDVLQESGLDELNPDIFSTTWKYPDLPLTASVFDNLEKKYSDGTTELRSVRRLFFDRINSALVEIFQRYVDTCPWVKPAIGRGGSIWKKHGLMDAVNILLGGEEDSANRVAQERMLDREMEWFDFRDDIDMVGKQIEKLLIDELIMEIVTI